MSFALYSPGNSALISFVQWKSKFVALRQPSSSLSSFPKRRVRVKAFLFNPIDEPILKDALKVYEYVTLVNTTGTLTSFERCHAYTGASGIHGGMFAGFLRLDLNEDPLKEWVARTVEASGITEEEIDSRGAIPEEEESPQQIEIE